LIIRYPVYGNIQRILTFNDRFETLAKLQTHWIAVPRRKMDFETSAVPSEPFGGNLLNASITLASWVQLPLPQCQSRKSRTIIDPFGTIGCEGGLICLRSSSKFVFILPLARSPWAPSWVCSPASTWVPSHTSVDPFSGFMVTSGTLTTRANGCEGWSKSASE
jgi:hypothetical protein